MSLKKILIVFGTRPEAIKMAPICIEAAQFSDIELKICVTGQHREMLDQAMKVFDIEPDFNLDVMSQSQTLTTLTSKILIGMSEIFDKYKPDLTLVHGDTTTAFTATLASFYNKIPVGHVEAGLRTGDIYSPWPEEANRTLISKIAKYHFCPTEISRANLLEDGVSGENIFITGNTVVDSLRITHEKFSQNKKNILKELIATHLNDSNLISLWEDGIRKVVLITGHRRENFGNGFNELCKGIRRLAEKYPYIDWVYPVHLNPNISVVVRRELGGVKNIYLIPPIGYESFIYMMTLCQFILTDSGGIQEEAPTFKKPVLVMRENSERPEAVDAGVAKLIGMDSDSIFRESSKLIENEALYSSMSNVKNPYGDGFSANKILKVIRDNV